jgi:polysaccharide pyruvyl transferase WcaK-like protein
VKALLVGDNLSNQNWGGRAASLALFDLLKGEFELTGTIPGSAFNISTAGFGYVQTLLPARFDWLYLNLIAHRRRRKAFDLYMRFEEFFGAKDFVAHDPAQTVQNILKCKGKNKKLVELLEKAEAADVIIIHGEGDIVLTSPPRREALFLLGMAALGLRLGKRIVFINSMISDCPVTGRNPETLGYLRRILSKCDVVTLRDSQSLEFASKLMPEVRCHLVPDSLFTWYSKIRENCAMVPGNGDFILPFPDDRTNFNKLDFSKPYICLGGSALAAGDQAKSVGSFTRLLLKLQKLEYPVYLVETCPGDAFLQTIADQTGTGFVPVRTSVLMGAAILANARLFVSGRYHPAIMASLGGTPNIFLQSTAHKCRSIQTLLEYKQVREFSVYPCAAELDEIFNLAQQYLSCGEEFRETVAAAVQKRCEEASRLPDLLRERISGRNPAADNHWSPQLVSANSSN